MDNNNINPNLIITPIIDCLGTCKTPIGCTCGKRKPQRDTSANESKTIVPQCIVGMAEAKANATMSLLQKEMSQPARLCSCGRSETGLCGCSSKKGGGCCSGTNKLEVYNWMQDMPDIMVESKMVEVQFKNTRKEYFLNSNNIELYKGDVVAVEASPGHDIGEVTLTGKLVELQMKKTNYRGDLKRVYRIAKPNDIEKYEQSKAKEHKTMLRAREIAEELQLDMKISDVEFQGDGNKAIFYYIADGRVDFRQLIKHYASEFRVKIEMKQIGARQEAGRVGGIGPCGRELCCSSSMANFVSVSTSAARLQDIPLNPQKLAGQCGKLKCCLNFEVDTYVEAQKKLPARDTVLETKDSAYFHFKTDILSGMMTYSTDKHFAANLVTLPRDRVFDVIKQNRRGDKPLTLADHELEVVGDSKSLDVLEQESITRFDNNSNKDKGRRNNNRRKRDNRQENNNRAENNQNNKNVQEGQGNKNLRKKDNPKKVVNKNPEQAPQQQQQQPNGDMTQNAEQQQQKRAARRRNNRDSSQRQHRNRDRGNQNKQNRNAKNERKDDKASE